MGNKVNFKDYIALLGILLLAWKWFFNIQFSIEHVHNKNAFLKRFDYPSSPIQTVFRVAPRHQRQNRVFISSIPIQVGDGLGHRLAMTNFELVLSIFLNAGYAHRFSKYGSLSPSHDLYAVDRMYGFVDGLDSRINLLRSTCSEIITMPDACRKPNIVCKTLRPPHKGGIFHHLVNITPSLTECFSADAPVKQQLSECVERTTQFAEKHNKPDTLFQMTPSICHTAFRIQNMTLTKEFLRAKYWRFHSRYGSVQSPSFVQTLRRKLRNPNESIFGMFRPTDSRQLSLSPHKVQIAVHIRRGDFFHYTTREIIPDEMYADVICEILKALKHSTRRAVPTMINIYSEGIAKKIASNHNISSMKKIYLNERGHPMPKNYWPLLIQNRLQLLNETVQLSQIKLHIATDTISAVHDMISADFFIGSRSGLSTTIVKTYSRGLLILPLSKLGSLGRGSRENYLTFKWGSIKPKPNSWRAELNRDKLRDHVHQFVQIYKDQYPFI